MASNPIDKLDLIQKTFEFLGRFKIQFGIFKEDSQKMETINVYNLDGSVTQEKMPLSDIMYLTEKGTITLPPKPVFEKIAMQISYNFPRVFEEIIHGVLHENWEKKEIRNRLKDFNFIINTIYIPNAIQMIISSDNVISGILNAEEDQNYTFDLKKLQKFIKSEIFFSD